MLNPFYRNRQLLILTLILIVFWGLSAFFTLPRMEDPEITQRVSRIVTFFPGATPERVESLVTERVEQALFELEEIDSVRSTSSSGLSSVVVELKESIQNVSSVWAEVRNKINDVVPDLPAGASEPEFRESTLSASALIVGLTWELETTPHYTILQRVARNLEVEMRALPSTEELELFGAPEEEIQVKITPAELAQLGLTAQNLAQQIQFSDAKIASGRLRSQRNEFLIEVDSALDSLERIRQIPIQIGNGGQVAWLGEIAEVTKGVQEPASELAIVNGYPAVVLSATVAAQERVDLWAEQAQGVLEAFQTDLSDGIGLHIILDQSRYVQQRLNGVIANLVLGSVLVVTISLLMLGWKSALIVGTAMPLSSLMVFGCMRTLDISLHQISVTGIIIALGLLVDNAIVVVDEVQSRLRNGMQPATAVSTTVHHLTLPLLASTLTTVLAFIPIATSPGGVGEFVGTIGLTTIAALLSSLFLSLTVIPALVGRLAHWELLRLPQRWWHDGFANEQLTEVYRETLRYVFQKPWLGVGLSLVLPIMGFVQFGTLEQQFFPPTNRDQFQIEVDFPEQTAIAQSQAYVLQARDLIRQHSDVDEVHWFLGGSAPSFVYNIRGWRENEANYAQAIVQLNSAQHLRATIQSLQQELDAAFPQGQFLVKQLEQGPPFDAPIELRISGPDLEQLRQLGNHLRGELAQVEDVIHTQASLTEALPTLALTVDEVQARRTGLDNSEIANQLDTALEGVTGGSLLEGTEDIPVRVRLRDRQRSDLAEISSLDLLSSGEDTSAIPLDALASVDLVPSVSTIARRNGQRVNIVQGFITAGALPSTILTRFMEQLEQSDFTLPSGYRLEYGGEVDARGTAISNLLSTVGLLLILMMVTLVLSFNSFGLAGLIASVSVCAIGLAVLALRIFNAPFGFTAILGTLGLVGLAINDSIVVLAALRDDPLARQGNTWATQAVVLKSTRHVLATTLTTMAGFIPLLLDETGFWPPLAIAITGGLGGATVLSLCYIPSVHLLLTRRNRSNRLRFPATESAVST